MHITEAPLTTTALFLEGFPPGPHTAEGPMEGQHATDSAQLMLESLRCRNLLYTPNICKDITETVTLHDQAAGRLERVKLYHSPVVLQLHAGEILQSLVACVKCCLEVCLDHHLLCSSVQHAEYLR